MSYLIALYVFYHGNNLPIFGVTPGMQEEKPLNQGLEYKSESELSNVLPEDVAQSIVEERKKAKLLDYESILREAIEQSQNETAKLMNSSVNIERHEDSTKSFTTYDDDYTDYDMSFFDEMNGMRDRNNGFPF